MWIVVRSIAAQRKRPELVSTRTLTAAPRRLVVPTLRGSLHFHDHARLRAETNEIIEREPIHPISHDLRDPRLRDNESASSFRLREPVAIDPPAQRLSQLASQEHDRRFVGLEAEVCEDVPAALRHGSVDCHNS